MTPQERNDLIAKYASGYDEVMNALNGFPADSLGAHPIPGKWSAREIVHHLGDSETTSAWRLRKLLVEDNPLDVELIRLLLMEKSRLQFHLHITTDGIEAMQWLRNKANPKVDLMLLDINMPRMDGFEVLKAVKKDEDLRQIPILMLSTSDDESDIRHARELGATGYMTKPANIEQFGENIARAHYLQLVQNDGGILLMHAA